MVLTFNKYSDTVAVEDTSIKFKETKKLTTVKHRVKKMVNYLNTLEYLDSLTLCGW